MYRSSVHARVRLLDAPAATTGQTRLDPELSLEDAVVHHTLRHDLADLGCHTRNREPTESLVSHTYHLPILFRL